MYYVLGLDVGTTQTGYCITNSDTLRPFKAGKIDNENIYEIIDIFSKMPSEKIMALEQFSYYGKNNSIGSTTIDSITWNGKFMREAEIKGIPCELVYRKDEKMLIIGNTKCGDKEIRQSLIRKFALTANGKGTKKYPDFFYGFARDMWSAYSVCLVLIMRKKGITKASEWINT